MNFLNLFKKVSLLIVCLLLAFPIYVNTASGEKIGVLYVVHGGMENNETQYMWDAAVLQFSFDHNHAVYKLVIWNSANWPMVLDTNVSDFTLKYLRMFEFEYERIGGTDPFNALSEQQLADMKTELDANTYGHTFEVEWAGYQCADRPANYPYPATFTMVPTFFQPGITMTSPTVGRVNLVDHGQAAILSVTT